MHIEGATALSLETMSHVGAGERAGTGTTFGLLPRVATLSCDIMFVTFLLMIYGMVSPSSHCLSLCLCAFAPSLIAVPLLCLRRFLIGVRDAPLNSCFLPFLLHMDLCTLLELVVRILWGSQAAAC